MMTAILAALALFQVQPADPIRFIISHKQVGENVRNLLSVPITELDVEANKVAFQVRKQEDSIAIYSSNLYDVRRIDLALRGQRALAEIVRRKQTKFSLGGLSNDDREGLAELMKRAAQNIGSAALDPSTQISVGFHYYVTLESNGKRVEDVISVVPPTSGGADKAPTKSEPYVDDSAPPDINSLHVLFNPKRTPSQRRAKALSDLMTYFAEVLEKQNEELVRAFAALEEAGAWDQSVTKGMAAKGLEESIRDGLLNSLSLNPERHGFRDKAEIEHFLESAKVASVRRVPSLGASGVLDGKLRSVRFSATVNRGG